MDDNKPFLTLCEVAALLDVTPARARQLCHSGAIPHVRRGRRLLVPADAWERWIREQADQAMTALVRR